MSATVSQDAASKSITFLETTLTFGFSGRSSSEGKLDLKIGKTFQNHIFSVLRLQKNYPMALVLPYVVDSDNVSVCPKF